MPELHSLILELLEKRGVRSAEEVEEFLSNKPRTTYDPFLLLNMDAGVDIVLSAVSRGEKICIYGDYDTDGITSVTILMEVLSQMTSRLSYYIPSRFDEGYGLNEKAIDRIRAAGVDLLITVDCGSVSKAEVAHAQEIGLDVLVTDHHQVTEEKLPDCPVINPAQKDCTYPFKFLAGCGVAFKLAQALTEEAGLSKQVLNRTLDLVAIGTVGDIVPLIDENRTLTKYGLRAINTRNRKNLDLLVREIGLKPGHVTAENLSFAIVPHLNAAGRMQHASLAADLFLTKDEVHAAEQVQKLVQLNRERRDVQEQIYRACREQIERERKNDPFLLLDLEDAPEGVTGIVAGKIKETYHKPTVIVTEKGDGTSKGTGRGTRGMNLYALLKQEEAMFSAFGGHAAACGFTMQTADVGRLRADLNAAFGAMIEADPSLKDDRREADLFLRGEDLSLSFVEQIELLAPFGNSNERPLVSVTGSPEGIRRIGKEGQYLKFDLSMPGAKLACTDFRKADETEKLLEGAEAPVSLVGALQINEWNGSRTLQMNVSQAECFSQESV